MSHYRAHVVGRDGHFMKSVILDFADDGAAFESAKRLVDEHDIELWRRDRMITKFRRTTIQTNVAPSASSLNVGCPVEACMTFNGRYAQNEHGPARAGGCGRTVLGHASPKT